MGQQMSVSENDLRIRDIKDGQPVNGVYLVQEMSRGETRAGKPYLSLILMDAGGEISGRVWENADRLAPECPVGAIIRVSAQAQSYKGIVQLKIDGLHRLAEGEADPALFMPSTPYDVEEMAAEFLRLAAGVKEPFYRKLLLAIFQDQDLMAAFRKAPGAKAMHHAYAGGLLEHTLAVARLADSVCRLYPQLDRSLLLAGAMLHDLGKLQEFSFAALPYDYSDRGRLVGHMVLGIEMIQARIAAIKDFPQELGDRLKHLVLSHHGRHEFGSPSLPMMQEAFVLNFIDDLDAKMGYLDRLAGQARGEGYQWSEYQRNLERFLFIRGRGGDTENELPPSEEEHNPAQGQRQTRLF